MTEMLISIGADAASDAWGFVGVVKVGETEAFRTLEAFSSPATATAAAQALMADVLGEILAGREWRRVRDDEGHAPTRQDFALSALGRHVRAELAADSARLGDEVVEADLSERTEPDVSPPT